MYGIGSSHIVKETSACVCHLRKGTSEYADTLTNAQADLSLSGRLGVWDNFKLSEIMCDHLHKTSIPIIRSLHDLSFYSKRHLVKRS